MRRWIAALALVPAVAWGQSMTTRQCVSEQANLHFVEIALAVMERHEAGASERELVSAVTGEGQLSAAMMAAIDAVYRDANASPAQVARAMAIACHDYASRR